MPENIEIKARARDPERQRALAAVLATAPVEVLAQVDTFFNAPVGRMKLRQLRPDFGQLILYFRDDVAGPKLSMYTITPTHEPERLRATIRDDLGIRGEVRKQRTIYLVGQTRIHFDEVEQLGSFIELEVVLREGQSLPDAQEIANALMRQLDVNPEDLIDKAYIDLLSNE